jgi:hypothetical protein
MDDIPNKYHLTERIVTLPTQKKDEVSRQESAKWQESHSVEEKTETENKNVDSEMSREEQILDMLKKVEKQKRLLLQEFGSSLPDDIFNVSIKPLLDERVPKNLQTANPVKSSSPEIKVINMSNSDEREKKDKKLKLSTKKSEIAVQTTLDKINHAEDKGIQVELYEENINVLHDINETTKVPHPIEPKIIIVSPETDDSSNDSTSSEISGLIIEIDKKEVTVTPKKKKNYTKLSLSKLSPRIYQKIRAASVSSKVTSPTKRFSKVQKKTKCADSDSRIDIQQVFVSKSAVNDKTDPLQETKISIDASAESSQTISSIKKDSSKPYRIRTQTKKWIHIKDTSDTSTSFTSPPPVRPKAIFNTNVTPILEMLDVSEPEELRRLRQTISPVSTPETPSPCTMAMPSNIPHREKITKILKYNLTDSQMNDSIIVSSTQMDQSIEQSMNCQSKPTEHITAPVCSPLQQPSVPCRVCTCKNPTCKLLHTKLDDIHDYALKNCPEILQKYEDLQSLCTERIASLTDLIEKVRNEQKGKN